MLKSTAIAVIGALLFSDMLSLVATATVYSLLCRGQEPARTAVEAGDGERGIE